MFLGISKAQNKIWEHWQFAFQKTESALNSLNSLKVEDLNILENLNCFELA